jgi:hypothetical protein
MADASNTSANRYKGNDIDTDGDGRVGKADHASNASNAQNVKGNDIDSDGDGQVDAADYADTAGDADTVDGQHASDLISNNPNLLVGDAQVYEEHTGGSNPGTTIDGSGTILAVVWGNGTIGQFEVDGTDYVNQHGFNFQNGVPVPVQFDTSFTIANRTGGSSKGGDLLVFYR